MSWDLKFFLSFEKLDISMEERLKKSQKLYRIWTTWRTLFKAWIFVWNEKVKQAVFLLISAISYNKRKATQAVGHSKVKKLFSFKIFSFKIISFKICPFKIFTFKIFSFKICSFKICSFKLSSRGWNSEENHVQYTLKLKWKIHFVRSWCLKCAGPVMFCFFVPKRKLLYLRRIKLT